jgi:hypothetical protein
MFDETSLRTSGRAHNMTRTCFKERDELIFTKMVVEKPFAIAKTLNQGWFALNQGWFALNQGWFALNQGWFALNQGWFALNQGWFALN